MHRDGLEFISPCVWTDESWWQNEGVEGRRDSRWEKMLQEWWKGGGQGRSQKVSSYSPLEGPEETHDAVTEVKKSGLIWEHESVQSRSMDISRTNELPSGHKPRERQLRSINRELGSSYTHLGTHGPRSPCHAASCSAAPPLTSQLSCSQNKLLSCYSTRQPWGSSDHPKIASAHSPFQPNIDCTSQMQGKRPVMGKEFSYY